MAFESGTRLASYEILSAIGRGGMGEVYRARDTKLGREVAIKVLPAEFAQDAERIARLEHEARMLAALNHPNIAAIHGLEESDATRFLVLELVEGDTLADRIRRGPMPVEEALKLALQVAEALEAAHEKGVIHRDLKPANIKITPEGRVKVLDFGLAKALTGDQADVNLSNSPTLSATATRPGELLGTAAYMAPEQARGQSADHRADVWAFGAVLFEMLAGRQAFAGDSLSDILASVLAREPDYASLPERLGPGVRRVLQRCLEKVAARRWQSTADLRIEVEDINKTGGEVGKRNPLAGSATVVPAAGPDRRQVLAWGATALGAASLGGVLGWSLKPSDTGRGFRFAGYDVLPEGRPLMNLPGLSPRQLDISPDGTRYAYAATRGLWIRPMDDPESAFRVPGVEQALVTCPSFSPDGERLAYWSIADARLNVIDVGGGPPRELIQLSAGPEQGLSILGDLSWGREDELLLAGEAGILRLSPASGASEVLIPAGDGEVLMFPRHLPGDDAVLFLSWTGEVATLGIYSRASRARRSVDLPVVAPPAGARFLPSGGPGESRGHLVFFEVVTAGLGGRGRGRGGRGPGGLFGFGNAEQISLSAVAFDLASFGTTGRVGRLLNGVRFLQYAVSDSGTLVYIPSTEAASTRHGVLAWVDPETGVGEPIPGIEPGPYRHPRLSPDGTRLAFERDRADGADVLVHDLGGLSAPRLLPGSGNNSRPLWKDDTWLSFVSDREGPPRVYRILADFQGTAVPVTPAGLPEGVGLLQPDSWSPDGTTLVYTTVGPGRRVWILEDGQEDPVLYAPPEALGAEFSPDGRWLVYRRNDDVQGLVLKQFPDTGDTDELAIETASGSYAVFSKATPAAGMPLRLFYRHAIGDVAGTGVSGTGFSGLADLFAVEVTLEPRVTYSQERPLAVEGFLAYGDERDYDVARDGRFVVVLPEEAEPAPPGIRMRLNWFADLNERAPRL